METAALTERKGRLISLATSCLHTWVVPGARFGPFAPYRAFTLGVI